MELLSQTKTKLLLILLLLLAGCNERQPSKDIVIGASNYYEDIDIYNLTGIKPSATKNTPCFEISDSGDKRIVVHHIEPNLEQTYIYNNVDGIWQTTYESIGDTSERLYFYEYILPEKVVTFCYAEKNATYLDDMTIIQGNKQTILSPNKGTQIRPGIKNIDTAINAAISIFTTEAESHDSVLAEKNIKVDKNGRVLFEFTNCYKNPGKSFFWCLSFKGMNSQRIDCNEQK